MKYAYLLFSGTQCISVLNTWSACSYKSHQILVGPLLSLNVDGIGLNFFEICLLHLSPLVQASIKLSKENQNKRVIYLQCFLSGKFLVLVKLISTFFSSLQYILLQKYFPKFPWTFTMMFDKTKWKKYSLWSAWCSKRELLIHLFCCKLYYLRKANSILLYHQYSFHSWPNWDTSIFFF